MSSTEDEITGIEAVHALLTHTATAAEQALVVLDVPDECDNCTHHPWHVLTLTAARMVSDSPLPDGAWQWVWYTYMATPVVEV